MLSLLVDYTFNHVRNRSSALLSAICYASSKFFLKPLTDKLWTHCRGVLGRAVIDSECTLELVQMICVLVFWKKPTDRNAWLDIGIAVRMAQRLNLKYSSRQAGRDAEEFPDGMPLLQERFVSVARAGLLAERIFRLGLLNRSHFHSTYIESRKIVVLSVGRDLSIISRV